MVTLENLLPILTFIQIICDAKHSAAFANVFPVSIALYARVAPAALSATIIGIYYLAFFAGNNLVGLIGGLLEKMPATQFWLLHAALAGIAGITFFSPAEFSDTCSRLV
jgi:proton-dependent oligopeptide transporter, POT family